MLVPGGRVEAGLALLCSIRGGMAVRRVGRQGQGMKYHVWGVMFAGEQSIALRLLCCVGRWMPEVGMVMNRLA